MPVLELDIPNRASLGGLNGYLAEWKKSFLSRVPVRGWRNSSMVGQDQCSLTVRVRERMGLASCPRA